MSVLMSKKRAAAIASVDRDKHLLTDKACEERIDEAWDAADTKCHGAKGAPMTEQERVEWTKLRMKLGQ